MSDRLRVLAFAAYLIALLVIVIAWALGMLLRKRSVAMPLSMPVVVGTLLQVCSPVPITMGMSAGSLRPASWELIGVLILAPFGAGLFVAMLLSSRGMGQAQMGQTQVDPTTGLATGGAFALVRHPMYLAFLAMVLATGMVVSARWTLLAAVAIYIAGTEMRVRLEETELAERGQAYAAYCERTKWRYLPGLR